MYSLKYGNYELKFRCHNSEIKGQKVNEKDFHVDSESLDVFQDDNFKAKIDSKLKKRYPETKLDETGFGTEMSLDFKLSCKLKVEDSRFGNEMGWKFEPTSKLLFDDCGFGNKKSQQFNYDSCDVRMAFRIYLYIREACLN